MKQFKFLIIGESLIRFSPTDNTNIKQTNAFNCYVGGDCSNVACLLGQLNNNVSYFTILPPIEANLWTQKIIKTLLSCTVNCDLIQTYPGRIGIYYFFNANSFNSSFVLYDRNQSSYLLYDWSLLNENLKILKKIDLIHISGISLYANQILRNHLYHFLIKAKKLNIKISIDLNYRIKLWNSYKEFKTAIIPFLKLADICFGWLNKKDQFFKLNSKTLNQTKLIQLSQWTWDNFNLTVICSPIRSVISNDLHEVLGFVRTKEQTWLSDIIKFNPIHPIGAGDSFVGGFLSQFFLSNPYEKKIQFATNAYAIKHIFDGDINLASYDEINNVSLKINNKILR